MIQILLAEKLKIKNFGSIYTELQTSSSCLVYGGFDPILTCYVVYRHFKKIVHILWSSIGSVWLIRILHQYNVLRYVFSAPNCSRISTAPLYSLTCATLILLFDGIAIMSRTLSYLLLISLSTRESAFHAFFSLRHIIIYSRCQTLLSTLQFISDLQLLNSAPLRSPIFVRYALPYIRDLVSSVSAVQLHRNRHANHYVLIINTLDDIAENSLWNFREQ